MKTHLYIPDRSDIIWLDLNPTVGKEQQGIRPVVVLSDKKYNRFGLLISVPITSKKKGYVTEIELPQSMLTHGVILSNHVRTHDWKLRNVEFIEKLPIKILDSIDRRIRTLLHL